MAPTICTEKESRVRSSIRESTKRLQNSQSSSVISYAGKITHRRSVAVRSATSKLTVLRLQHSESTDESEDNEEEEEDKNKDDIEIFSTSPSPSIDENCDELMDCENSITCRCSDRLHSNDNDCDYITNKRCRFCYTKNDIIMYNDRNYSDETASNYSTFSSWDSEDCSSYSDKIAGKRPPSNNKGLLDIAVKTVKLIKRNQQLQRKLAQLQFETKEFIESVMSNPENHALREKMTDSKKVEA